MKKERKLKFLNYGEKLNTCVPKGIKPENRVLGDYKNMIILTMEEYKN